jgi:hypothetical protein
VSTITEKEPAARIRELQESIRCGEEFIETYRETDPVAANEEQAYIEQLQEELKELEGS